MRRRDLLTLAAASAALLLTPAPGLGDTPGIALANELAAAYAAWGLLYEHRNPGALDLHEVRAWKNVEDRYSALRKHLKLEYSE